MSSLLKAMSIVWKHSRAYFISTFILSIIDIFSVFIIARLNGNVFNSLADSINRRVVSTDLVRCILMLFGVTILCGGIKLPINYLASLSATKYNDYLTQRTVNVSSNVEYSFFDDPKLQNEYQQYLKNSESVLNIFNNVTGIAFKIISLTISTIVALKFNFAIVIITFVISLPSFFIRKRIEADNYELEKNLNQTNRKINYFKNIFCSKQFYLELNLFQAHNYFKKILMDEQLNRYNKRKELNSRNFRRESFLFGIISVVNALVNIYIIIYSVSGGLLIGDYTYYMTILNNQKNEIDQAMELINALHANKKKVENFFSFEAEISKDSSAGNRICEEICEIEFQNVSFKYPGNVNFALINVNIKINKNQKVAFAGLNGAGKTTLVLLLLRYYVPSDGRILVNGIDINEYDIDSYRKNITTMFQASTIYSLTLKENIKISDLDTYCSDSDLAKFLEELDILEGDNLNALNISLTKNFDDDGIIPSVGQLQRINLAKTLYRRQVSLLIFDEPSSSLDALTENNIFSNLLNKYHDSTIIMISHNLSNLKKFDKIFFFEKGHLIEQGTHEELLLLNGQYCKLYSIQSKKFL